MKRVGIVLALLFSPSTAAHSQASQRNFEHALFTRAGFPPIAEVRASGRDVRRLLLQDPYGMLPVPGIEVERLRDGRVTLRLQYWAWTSDPLEIDRASWEALISRDQAVFGKPSPQPIRAQSSSPQSPPPICHGWIARFEASQELTASWVECGGGETLASEYAVQMVGLAMSAKPDCPIKQGDLFWSFNSCFAPKQALDAPELEAKYAILRRQYEEAPGADRLAEARRALNTPGLTLGSKAWLEARAAVARYNEVRQLRRERLQQLRQLAHGAATASDADKAKMRHTIESWSESMMAQEPNYSDLLQQLAWAGS